MSTARRKLSIVVPLHNEAAALQLFHDALTPVLSDLTALDHEIIYVNDGSTDSSAQIIQQWHEHDRTVKLVSLSRNFGKENALTAGIAEATGDAILTLDADGQHPVEAIPAFVEAWQKGAQVVIGIRRDDGGIGWFKKLGSGLFYKSFNNMTGEHLVPRSTDFRLIDQQVRQAFLRLNESDRITRGLIDWLGFRREYIKFNVQRRVAGTPTYSNRKLFQLATHSFISLSARPLYAFGYFGVFITLISFVVGIAVGIEQLLLGDPLSWNFTGTAMLSMLLLFLVGILLMSQGALAVYISYIHKQSKQRPLYIIDQTASAGIRKHEDQ
jgi:dolichol-phosphate mannosyltransferase